MRDPASYYETLADEVRDLFFSRDADPTSTLAKVAQRETLNPEEIRRVAERANQGIFADLRKDGSSDHTFEFPLADIDRVGVLLHPTKIASSRFVKESVRSKPAPKFPVRDYGFAPTKTARLSAAADLYDHVLEVEAMQKDAWMEKMWGHIDRFCKSAHLTAHEYGLSLGQIYKSLVVLRPKEAQLTEALLSLTSDRTKLPFDKEAAAPWEDRLVPKDLVRWGSQPVRVVNGEHTLIMQLDTMSDMERRGGPTLSKATYVKSVQDIVGKDGTFL